jgi:isopentenyl phosphate kinase
VALIGDHRNDENLAVSQTHLAFLKFHNKVVDHLVSQGTPPSSLFDDASKQVRWHYQWMVLHDWVERITEPGIVAKLRTEGCPRGECLAPRRARV